VRKGRLGGLEEKRKTFAPCPLVVCWIGSTENRKELLTLEGKENRYCRAFVFLRPGRRPPNSRCATMRVLFCFVCVVVAVEAFVVPLRSGPRFIVARQEAALLSSSVPQRPADAEKSDEEQEDEECEIDLDTMMPLDPEKCGS